MSNRYKVAMLIAQMMLASEITGKRMSLAVVKSHKTKEELNRERGLNLYEFYDGDKVIFSCWARNQKNADRKFNNFKKLRKE